MNNTNKTIGVLALLFALALPVFAKAIRGVPTSIASGLKAVSAKVYLEDLPESARPWATISRTAQFEIMHEWVGTVPDGLMLCLNEGWSNVVPRPNEGTQEEVR